MCSGINRFLVGFLSLDELRALFPRVTRADFVEVVDFLCGWDHVTQVLRSGEVPPNYHQLCASLGAIDSGVSCLDYVLGYSRFLNWDFVLSRGVFVPRSETELMVEIAAERLVFGAEVLEIGVGSGVIGISFQVKVGS